MGKKFKEDDPIEEEVSEGAIDLFGANKAKNVYSIPNSIAENMSNNQ